MIDVNTNKFGESLNKSDIETINNKFGQVGDFGEAHTAETKVKENNNSIEYESEYIYDKDGIVIEDGEVLYTPDGRHFIASGSGDRFEAKPAKDSAYPNDCWVSFKEPYVYDSVLHRPWTKEESQLYTAYKVTRFRLIAYLIICTLSIILLLYNKHPNHFEILSFNLSFILIILSSFNLRRHITRLRNFNKGNNKIA